jgi:hypothetical protein
VVHAENQIPNQGTVIYMTVIYKFVVTGFTFHIFFGMMIPAAN